jgi:hypothetical protein
MKRRAALHITIGPTSVFVNQTIALDGLGRALQRVSAFGLGCDLKAISAANRIDHAPHHATATAFSVMGSLARILNMTASKRSPLSRSGQITRREPQGTTVERYQPERARLCNRCGLQLWSTCEHVASLLLWVVPEVQTGKVRVRTRVCPDPLARRPKTWVIGFSKSGNDAGISRAAESQDVAFQAITFAAVWDRRAGEGAVCKLRRRGNGQPKMDYKISSVPRMELGVRRATWI